MEASLHLVPSSSAPTQVSTHSTSNSLGTHDTLRHGFRSLAVDVAPKHPLAARLDQWEQTQENLQMTMQRNMFGLHAPVRLLMERQIVSQTPLPPSFGGVILQPSNIALDILKGKDESIDVSDVLIDRVSAQRDTKDFHYEMEQKLRML